MPAWFFSTLILMASAIPHPSVDTPTSAAVYLRPYSSVPTGHYNLDLLKSRMVSHQKIQWVFVKDTQTGVSGWTLKQNLLTPLHFSSRARLMAQSPIFREKNESVPLPEFKNHPESTVQLLEIQNDWAQIDFRGSPVWVPTAYLFAVDKDAGYFYSRSEQPLRAKPQTKSAFLTRVAGGRKLVPQEIRGGWVKVTIDQKTGYFPLDQVVSRVDIASRVKTPRGFVTPTRELLRGQIYSISVNPLWLGTGMNKVPLFASPQASSSVSAYISPWQNLMQQDSILQEWAVSQIPQLGPVWWELPDERTILQKMVRLNLATVRKVEDNPLFANLKLATANGLFRSTDGVSWAPIKGFENRNPAFAFAKDGVLFVEDKMSFDNGEHFAPFVFWENLFYQFRLHSIGVPGAVKITRIEALGPGSRQVVMDLDIGNSRPVRVSTADRGQSWAILTR